MEETKQIQKLKKKYSDWNINAFFVSNATNISYLLSRGRLQTYKEGEQFLLITNTLTILIVNSLSEVNEDACSVIRLKTGIPFGIQLRDILMKYHVTSLGVEGNHLSKYEFDTIERLFSGKLISFVDEVERLRMIKRKDELLKIKKSAQACDSLFMFISQCLKKSISEKEVVKKIEMWIIERGYRLSFEPIVLFGDHTSVPHAHASSRRLQETDWVLVDCGVNVEGYQSDCTRMFMCNKTPKKILKACLRLEHICKKIPRLLQIGTQCSKFDAEVRMMMKKEKLTPPPHSIGHGVGCSVHEYPKLSQRSVDQISSGCVFTLEPGTYVPQSWGVRMEDMFMMSSFGKVEQLTKTPLVVFL